MKTFSGFPSGRVHIVGVPRPVFTDLIPIIDDLGELKLTLHVIWRLSQQQGELRCLRFEDLASDEVLLSGLGEHPAEALRSALNLAVERGTLLRAEAPSGRPAGVLYFANTPKGRAAVEAIARGVWPKEIDTASRPNIFTLYEQNIGMLAPLIAEELREAEQTYPAAWIEDAFREAVTLNKRSWKYIQAILERWRTEGRGGSQDQRSAEADRRRYLEWKYGE
jgi:DnaD/phage-associated family protein